MGEMYYRSEMVWEVGVDMGRKVNGGKGVLDGQKKDKKI